MKWFRCVKCGLVDNKVHAPLTVTATIWLSKQGELSSDWEGELPLESLDVNALVCPSCGGKVEIEDVPCEHQWGETQLGYGDNKGKARRTCLLCGKEEIGTIAAIVWGEQSCPAPVTWQ